MEQLLWIFLCTAPAYAIAAHFYARRVRLRHSVVIAAHAVPTFAAACFAAAMFWPTDTAHDVVRMMSFLETVGPVMPFLVLATGSVHAAASLLLAAKPAPRRWLPLTLGGTAVCALGFFPTLLLTPRC